MSDTPILPERYKLVDKIGEGGTCSVYRVQDTHLKRDVAIKIVRGVYSHPRVAQNLWREVNDREANFMLSVCVGPKQHVTTDQCRVCEGVPSLTSE